MILKHRDRELLQFDWVKPFGVRNVELNRKELRFLPIQFREKAVDGVNKDFIWAFESWLLNRTAPMNRHFVREVMVGAGFNPGDPGYHCRLLEFCKGLSLNDVYWVVTDDFKESWRHCNLYQNSFSESIATLAFSGHGSARLKDVATSPEYTTNGVLAKCWRRKNGEISLWKGGSEASHGLEPYAEFYASQIAEKLGIDYVPYRLARYKNRICSVCPLFTSEQIGFVPVGKLLTRAQIAGDVRFADSFLLDAIILNDDRHLGNLGFLIDNDKNEICGIAPAFDNGHSFFSRPVERFAEGSPALYEHWDQFPGFDREGVIEKISRLQGFRLKKDARFNLSKTAFATAADFLSRRIEGLLNAFTKSAGYHANFNNEKGV